MRKLLLSFALVLAASVSAQFEPGSTFSLDFKQDQDVSLVLVDNYNHYLFSVRNVDGMLANHSITLRKFDQKNQLVDTYTYKFPELEKYTLYQYLGFAESKGGKLAVFIEGYSGKVKKCVLSKIVFDKATATFTPTELLSTDIQSAMKSGDASMEKSVDGRYSVVRYTPYRAKDSAEKTTIMVFDNGSFDKVWQKELSFTDKYVSRCFSVSNTGKVLLLRDASGWKQDTYMVYVSADKQEEKRLDVPVEIFKPALLTIGDQDYALAFGHPSKGLRGGDYGRLIFYDLTEGKVLKQNTVDVFGKTGTESVSFRDITISGDEINIIAEARVEVKQAPPTLTNGGFGSTSAFDKNYTFGPAAHYILGIDGTVKKETPLYVSEAGRANLFHVVGVLSFQGQTYVNSPLGAGLYRLGKDAGLYQKDMEPFVPYIPKNTRGRRVDSFTYPAQLMYYLPDSGKLIMFRSDGDGSLTIGSVPNVRL